MSKTEFLLSLAEGLSALPWEDAEERLSFYSEMIDDRMEEGLSEEKAVAAVGSVDEIVSQLLDEAPLTKLVKNKISEKKSWSAWEIVLLVLGSPIWLSLLLAAFAVIFAVYVSIWAVVVSLWAVFGSFVVTAFACIVSTVPLLFVGNAMLVLSALGTGLIFAALAIFLFFGCRAATIGTARLAKISVLGIKKCFTRKEGHNEKIR